MMKNQWYLTREHLPPQGQKIIWFSKGDAHIVQRFGKYWVPIPFVDSFFASLDPPEFWPPIQLPSPYEGKMTIIVHGEKMDIDTLEEKHPDVWRNIINTILKDFRENRKKNLKNRDKRNVSL